MERKNDGTWAWGRVLEGGEGAEMGLWHREGEERYWVPM